MPEEATTNAWQQVTLEIESAPFRQVDVDHQARRTVHARVVRGTPDQRPRADVPADLPRIRQLHMPPSPRELTAAMARMMHSGGSGGHLQP